MSFERFGLWVLGMVLMLLLIGPIIAMMVLALLLIGPID